MKYILITIILIFSNNLFAQTQDTVCLPKAKIIALAEKAKAQENENLILKDLNNKYIMQGYIYEQIRIQDSLSILAFNSQHEILTSINQIQESEILVYKNKNNRYKKYIKFLTITSGIFFGMFLIK